MRIAPEIQPPFADPNQFLGTMIQCHHKITDLQRLHRLFANWRGDQRIRREAHIFRIRKRRIARRYIRVGIVVQNLLAAPRNQAQFRQSVGADGIALFHL